MPARIMPKPKAPKKNGTIRKAMTPAMTAGVTARDHRMSVGSGGGGGMTSGDSEMDGSATCTLTRIKGALHCGQKAVPSSTGVLHW
jgi:hypothetical protein